MDVEIPNINYGFWRGLFKGGRDQWWYSGSLGMIFRVTTGDEGNHLFIIDGCWQLAILSSEWEKNCNAEFNDGTSNCNEELVADLWPSSCGNKSWLPQLVGGWSPHIVLNNGKCAGNHKRHLSLLLTKTLFSSSLHLWLPDIVNWTPIFIGLSPVCCLVPFQFANIT